MFLLLVFILQVQVTVVMCAVTSASSEVNMDEMNNMKEMSNENHGSLYTSQAAES